LPLPNTYHGAVERRHQKLCHGRRWCPHSAYAATTAKPTINSAQCRRFTGFLPHARFVIARDGIQKRTRVAREEMSQASAARALVDVVAERGQDVVGRVTVGAAPIAYSISGDTGRNPLPPPHGGGLCPVPLSSAD